MGLLDTLLGKKTDKTTTTNEYSKDVQELQKNLTKGVGVGISPYLKDPSVYVAPLNDYQKRYGTTASGLLDYLSTPNGNFTDEYLGMADQSGLLGRMGGINQYIPGYSQKAIDASTIDYGDIQKFANPLYDEMLGSQERQRGRAYEEAQRSIGDDAAGSAAFGGSGEALRRSQLDKNLIESAADDTAELGWQSYNAAAQLAGNNAAALSGAYSNEGNNLYNRGLGAAQYDDSILNDAFTRRMQAYGGASNASNSYQSNLTGAVGLLGGYGDKVQGIDQATGDKPYTAFTRFQDFLPKYQVTQTTKSPSQTPGLLQTALGAGLTIGSSPTAGGGSLFGSWFG